MVTRRQFGLWAVAAAVVPAGAWAGGQAPVAGLAAIDLTAKLAEKGESDLAIDLHATSRGKKGQSLRVHITSASIEMDGKESENLMSWMNDHNPMSRRMAPPAYVDVPPDKAILAGRVHVAMPEGWTPKSEGTVKLVITITDDMDVREMVLPAISLTKTREENS